ncbi:sulfite exporter TauE/SafE family protein [Arenibacter sp. GZD96]|uniref:sulfite exporter TauE/SafE family protein n=1 Tax=Aurantibrevibacter litoralis TaxID=3106030 RepID=UPI002AFF4206|nr:sulfite exporter TauE/SafE family protein [Arenibacter sp. GZD-96]MEA1787713.1 sulfite exporter TauE/SafE family protein [Arenibacter sp. GZD-96]
MTTELIILFAISFLAATISGAAGFGGALVLLPILTSIVGIKAAVPILTIGQIFGNASRVWFGRHELKWKPIIFFLLTAIPLTILGSYLFTDIDSNKIKIGIGVFLILLVIYRRTKIKKIALGDKGMLLGGGLTGFLSGLAGSAGPLGAAFFLGLNLTATVYIASEAFTALTMHLTKTIVYNKYSLIGQTELYYGLFIGVAMILGSWTGKKIIEKLNREKFILLVEILLIISGLQLIWTAI